MTMLPVRSLLTMCTAALACACARTETADVGTGALSLLTVPPTPTLELGVMEGDPDYSFEDVIGTLHLPSGSLAVADAGSDRISIFSPDGRFVRRVGGRGEGPGEFRDLAALYATGSDTIQAGDGMARTLLVFDPSGAYVRQLAAVAVSRDTVFALDSWLHGRYWVRGALAESARVPVRAALDALPPPAASPGFRVVLVAEDGRLWIREPATSGAGTTSWTIVDASGRPVSAVDLPAQLDPLEIRPDAVTGRWRGESDVNFVRTYAISSTDQTRTPPAWITAAPRDSTQAGPAPEEFLRIVRSAIKRMASAQEIHYASHGTYTTETDSLRWERPEGMEVTFAEGNARGWAAVFTHPGLDRVCALAYGFNVPPGWLPGSVLCSPER
jgi:hypothetical protein